MATQQQALPSVPSAEEAYEDDVQQEVAHEQYAAEEEVLEDTEEKREPSSRFNDNHEGRGGFVNGLSVGLGVGCIATFTIMWISLFFTPQMPSTISYETLLSIFIYPLIYLLAVGLVALTAGVVREYHGMNRKY